ncbi:MAG: LysM peptidoglycan-binding domain-containing protein [Vicinamibacterales bacterium]
MHEGVRMGIFDKFKDKLEPKPDFSNVQSGGSSTARAEGTTGKVAAPAQLQTRTYTVQKGDSLSRIAKREYGDAQQWRRIYDANRDLIKDPDLIQPGWTLTIPQ